MVRFYGTLLAAQEIYGLYLSTLNQNGTLQEPFRALQTDALVLGRRNSNFCLYNCSERNKSLIQKQNSIQNTNEK